MGGMRRNENWVMARVGWESGVVIATFEMKDCPVKKQNLVLSREWTPMKDEAPQLTKLQSQFNSEQPIKSPDASAPCSVHSPR